LPNLYLELLCKCEGGIDYFAYFFFNPFLCQWMLDFLENKLQFLLKFPVSIWFWFNLHNFFIKYLYWTDGESECNLGPPDVTVVLLTYYYKNTTQFQFLNPENSHSYNNCMCFFCVPTSLPHLTLLISYSSGFQEKRILKNLAECVPKFLKCTNFDTALCYSKFSVILLTVPFMLNTTHWDLWLLKIQQKTIIHEIIISYTANNNRRLIVNWTHPEYFIISSDIFAFNVSAWVSIQKKNPFILKNNWKTVYCKQELKSKNQIMMSKLTTTLDTHNY